MARTGETARTSGDLRCEQCRGQMHVDSGQRIPNCPTCGHDRFSEARV